METSSAANRPVAVVAACLALVAVALVGGRVAMAAAGPTSPEEFLVEGEIDGLYPGVVGVLDARILNPWDESIEVTSVVVVASDAGSACPGTMLRFAPTTGSVVVAAGSQSVMAIPVTLDAAAGDSCRGATWPLRFTARAEGPEGVDRTGAGPAAPPSNDGVLATTGAAIATTVALGIALVVLGVMVTRARRPRTGTGTG